MSHRPWAVALAVIVGSVAVAPALLAAPPKAHKPTAHAPQKPMSNAFLPTNIKRAVVKLGQISGMVVTVRTSDGKSLDLGAMNPQMMLLKGLRVAKAEQFKPGDKLVVYYNSPPDPKDMKLLWAAMDPPSEIILAELRAKPVEGTFKSFDAASRKLTVQVDGRAQTYTMVAPPTAIRGMGKAALGQPNTKEHAGYSAGDKLLLTMTARGKQVRLVTDKFTYDRLASGMKKFPVPPISKIPAK